MLRGRYRDRPSSPDSASAATSKPAVMPITVRATARNGS